MEDMINLANGNELVAIPTPKTKNKKPGLPSIAGQGPRDGKQSKKLPKKSKQALVSHERPDQDSKNADLAPNKARSTMPKASSK